MGRRTLLQEDGLQKCGGAQGSGGSREEQKRVLILRADLLAAFSSGSNNSQNNGSEYFIGTLLVLKFGPQPILRSVDIMLFSFGSSVTNVVPAVVLKPTQRAVRTPHHTVTHGLLNPPLHHLAFLCPILFLPLKCMEVDPEPGEIEEHAQPSTVTGKLFILYILGFILSEVSTWKGRTPPPPPSVQHEERTHAVSMGEIELNLADSIRCWYSIIPAMDDFILPVADNTVEGKWCMKHVNVYFNHSTETLTCELATTLQVVLSRITAGTTLEINSIPRQLYDLAPSQSDSSPYRWQDIFHICVGKDTTSRALESEDPDRTLSFDAIMSACTALQVISSGEEFPFTLCCPLLGS